MSGTLEETLRIISKEFDTAHNAMRAGNQGMVRVCARRAAGAAIARWLQSHPRNGWGIDAMSRLRALRDENTMPSDVRDAAARLGTKVTPRFASSQSIDPIGDARAVITRLLNITDV